MPIAKSVEDTVLGEALAGDYADILGVVSVIDNRSKQLGVSYKDVVSAKSKKGVPEFSAYGKAMPAGVSKYRGLVDKAIAEVQEKGPVHGATFYATPAAAKGLPKGLAFETKTAGHQYYSDPQGRAIGTAQGYKTPDPTAMATPQGLTDVAGQPAGTMYEVAEAAPSIATPSDQMGLLADFSKAPVAQAQTAGLLSKGLGLAALATPADLSRVTAQQAAPSGLMSFTAPSTAVRSMEPSSAITGIVEAAVSRLGPEYGWETTSAGQPAIGTSQNRVGSTRHDEGKAIDGYVTKAGVALDPVENRQAYMDTLTNLAEEGAQGLGHYGWGLHADVATPASWGPTTSRASLDPGFGLAIDQGRALAGLQGGYPTPTPAPRGQETFAAPVEAVERGTLGPASEPGLTDPSIAAPVGPSYNIDQAGLTAPGFTGPAARSVSTQSIGPGGLLSQAAPSGTSYGPAGQTPAGFAELGAIGKTGRVGVAAPAPESILGPIAMPTQQPYFAPVAPRAPTAPAMVAPVAPVAPQQTASQQASAPAPSMASAGDVWGGTAQTGRATNGNTVSRNPDGSVSMTSSKYGYTEVDGQYRGKVDPSTVGRAGIAGPLSGQGITGKAPGQTTARSGLGQGMRSVGGSVAGGMVGGLLGPIGGILGAYVGRQMAMGKNPFSGLLGRSQFSDFAGMAMPTPAAAQRSFQQGFTPGLGFPDAPNGPASQGGLSAYGEAASRGEFGGQAQSAADNPGKGLY